MRITFLLPSDNLTGGTRVVATYASELQRLGHQVLVITCAPTPPTLRQRVRHALRHRTRLRDVPPVPGHIALSGVPHQVMHRPGPIRAAAVPDADVVVATWWETAVWMHRLPASKGRPVHLIQGYEVWQGEHVRERVHAALRLPNTKIAISQGLADTVQQAVGPLPLQVVPNAVDLQQFHAAPRKRNAVPRLGFIYAQAPIKGADICIEACRLARARLPAFELLAFGTEEVQAALPLPEGTQYHLRPAQDALRQLYAQCDYWLFGSRLDSFGLPILEAMACRTPVIGVPVGAAPDLLPQGGGTLVDFGSAEAMAQAIVQLCSAPASDWQRRSGAAHALAHGYSWRDATQRLLQVLQVA